MYRGRNFRLTHTNSRNEKNSVIYPALILVKLKTVLHLINSFFLHGTAPMEQLNLGNDYVVGSHVFINNSGKVLRKIVGIFKGCGSGFLEMTSGMYLSELYWEKFTSYVEEILQCLNLNEMECEDKFGSTGGRWMRKQEVFRPNGDSGRFYLYYWIVVNEDNVLVDKSTSVHATCDLAKRSAKGVLTKQNKGQKLKIMQKPAIPPAATDFMKVCYMTVMHWKLMLEAKNGCSGCHLNSKEEGDHGPEYTNDLGCMSSVEKKAGSLFNHLRVRPNELIKLFDQLRSQCDVNPIPCYQLSRACIEYHDEKDFVEFFKVYPRKEEKVKVLQELVETYEADWEASQKKARKGQWWF